MKCKYCQTPLDWGEVICPECGRENPRPAKKKNNAVIWIAAVALVLVAAVLIGMVAMKTKGDNDEANVFTGGYGTFTVPGRNFTVEDRDWDEKLAAQVVGSCNEEKLTNATLSYYYWHAYYEFSAYLAGYVDPTKGLHEQSYGSYTWQQLLMQQALINWEENQALAMQAEKMGGDVVSQADIDVQMTLDSIQANVDADDRFATIDDYLVFFYGPYADLESYSQYIRVTQLASRYAETVAESIVYTDADIDDYYNKNMSTYLNDGIEKNDIANVNVRHILIQPEKTEDDASWAEAKKKAEDILAQWQAGEATEDSFAELAGEHTQDPGSASTGGLYENVFVGQMVKPFEEWCFDESRMTGDTGIVETSYGYHIMYFVETTDTYAWFETAKEDFLAEKQNEKLKAELEQYQYNLDFNEMALFASPLYGK